MELVINENKKGGCSLYQWLVAVYLNVVEGEKVNRGVGWLFYRMFLYLVMKMF